MRELDQLIRAIGLCTLLCVSPLHSLPPANQTIISHALIDLIPSIPVIYVICYQALLTRGVSRDEGITGVMFMPSASQV